MRPGLATFLALQLANLRKFEEEEARNQTPTQRQGQPPATLRPLSMPSQRQELRVEPQVVPIPHHHPTPTTIVQALNAPRSLTSSDDKEGAQSGDSNESSDEEFQPGESPDGSDREQVSSSTSSSSSLARSTSCFSPCNPDPLWVATWRKAYVTLQRLVAAESPNKTWTRREVLRLFSAPLKPGEEQLAFTKLKVGRSTLWQAAKTPGGGPVRKPEDRRRPGQLECSVTVEFFNENTHVRSGARNLTRRMALSKDEMYYLYRAQFPDLVRRAAERSSADSDLHGPLSSFLLSRLEVASRMSSAPGWTEVGELDRRREWYRAQNEATKTDRAAAGQKAPHHCVPVKADPDGIKARSERTFWRIMKRCGVRYVGATPNHNCDIHKNAEVNKRQLAKEEDELKKMEADLEDAREKMRRELDEASISKAKEDVVRLEILILPKRQAITKLQKDVDHAVIHFKHYAMALKYVKGIEYNLKENQVLLYRDFVNQYNEKGKKVNNLIFVVCKLSPDGDGNTIDYINNVAGAKCNSRFHASALDRFFRERGDLVPPGTELFISGDHGPHFWSWDTLMWQSTIYDQYKISVEIVGLCSYHAYNRCDSHGALIKKAAHRQACKGGGPITSTEFAALINKIPAADVRGIEVSTSFFMTIS